jgi:hypothetical protein
LGRIRSRIESEMIFDIDESPYRLLAQLMKEYRAVGDENLGETSFEADSRLVTAAILVSINDSLERIADALEAQNESKTQPAPTASAEEPARS